MATRKKAEYRSAIRSRKLIREAFLELIKEKKLGRITVTDIVTRADINRRTFYAHYQDVRALVDQIENETIEKIKEVLEEGRNENFFQEPLPLLMKMSHYLESYLVFYRILMNANEMEPFISQLKQLFVSYIEQDAVIPVSIKKNPEFAVASIFISGGIANIIQVWLRGDMAQSPDELIQSIAHLITTPLPLSLSVNESYPVSIMQK